MKQFKTPVFFLLLFAGVILLGILAMQPIEVLTFLDYIAILAPKGSMSFAGLKKPQDRAAVIKFLMSQSENPPPIPAAAETPAAAPAAPN